MCSGERECSLLHVGPIDLTERQKGYLYGQLGAATRLREAHDPPDDLFVPLDREPLLSEGMP